MRKFLSVMLPVFIMIAIAGICIGIYMAFTNGLPKFGKKSPLTNSLKGTPATSNSEVILSFEELPRIDAARINSTFGCRTCEKFYSRY